MSDSYDYIAYIDEAGDDGLKAVKPKSNPGSSEWLILSAVVVRAKRQSQVKHWVSDLESKVLSHQARSIHFAKLPAHKKALACDYLSGLEARYFVVASNKKNMEGYRNPDAEKIPSQCWFYCWMTRVLLEKVTHYVHAKSMQEQHEPRLVRVEFSERGGLRYSQMNAYFDWLKVRRRNPFLPWGKICWEVLHRDLFYVYPHWEREGLTLADIVASAFFKAVDKYDTGACDSSFAKRLLPRMARCPDKIAGQISGYGVKLLPGFRKAKLDADQAEIFKTCGYPKQWWDPEAFS